MTTLARRIELRRSWWYTTLPADKLRVIWARSAEPVSEAGQAPDGLKQSCERRIRYRAGDLPGALVTALLLGAR